MLRYTRCILVVLATLFCGAQRTVLADRCDGTINIGPTVTSFGTADPASTYVDYTHCRWNITGPANTQLTITFDATFDIEEAGPSSLARCSADYITILDTARPGLGSQYAATRICGSTGSIPASSFYGPHCGQTAPPPFIAKGNTAVVQFCSDYEITGAGWRINLAYAPIVPPEPIPETVVTIAAFGDTATLNSPNYPFNYRDDTNATYRIRNLVPNTAVVIKRNTFALGTTGCDDQLIIRDVTNNLLIITACARTPLPEELEIKNSSEVTLEFRSDEWDNFQGFSLTVSVAVCASSQFTCDNGIGCYNVSTACDGTRHCADGSDEKHEYCAPECGISHYPIAPDHTLGGGSGGSRVFGGIVANRHSLPWQASLYYNNGHSCGATIISDRWLISAAHCYRGRVTSSMKIRVGGFNIHLSDELDLSNTYVPEKVICHPYYAPTDANGNFYHDHDHCLVKLPERIKFRKNVTPACLPRQGGDVAPETRCMISGWGETLISNPGRLSIPDVDGTDINKKPEVEVSEKSDGPLSRAMPSRLRQSFVPIVNRTFCASIMQGATITPQMICGGNLLGDTNICGGDSGGPLICQKSDGRWQVEGASSFGPSTCNRPGQPFVWARIGSVVHWMIDTIATQ